MHPPTASLLPSGDGVRPGRPRSLPVPRGAPAASDGPRALAQAARAAGDFLLVGLHSDEDVRARRGPHLPIMDLHERALSVLACCHANEVIIGARARGSAGAPALARLARWLPCQSGPALDAVGLCPVPARVRDLGRGDALARRQAR